MPARTQPRALPARLAPEPRPQWDDSCSPLDVAPVLLAERAYTARARGHCALCPLPILPGDRCARLPHTSEPVHVACAATTPGIPR